MKRLLLLSLAMFIGIGLIIVSGCSDDDDDNPSSSGKTVGDPDDPRLEVMEDFSGQANFIIDLQLLGISFELYDSIPDAPPVAKMSMPNQDINISNLQIENYLYSNYWHIFTCSVYVAMVEDNDTTWFTYDGIDSIRVYNAAGYLHYPDESVIGMNIRAHLNAEFEGVDISGNIGNHASFDLNAIDLSSVLLNGLSHDSVDYIGVGESGTCDLSMYFYQGISDLLIDESVLGSSGGCPPSGSVGLVFTVNLDCEGTDEDDSLNIDGNWMANYVFDDGSIHITYENATTRWTYTGQCGDDGTTKWGWPEPLK